MCREIETSMPSGKPSLYKEDVKFVFNEELINSEYCLPAYAQDAVEKETSRLKESVESFLQRISTIKSMFPELLKGSQETRKSAHLDAEKAISAPRALQPFIAQFTYPPDEGKHLRNSDSIDEEWALYRWVQVQLLFALDVYVRYQGNIPEPLTPTLYEKLEHDVLDAEQLILGSLEGAFATRESKHKRWWALLRPDGGLYE